MALISYLRVGVWCRGWSISWASYYQFLVQSHLLLVRLPAIVHLGSQQMMKARIITSVNNTSSGNFSEHGQEIRTMRPRWNFREWEYGDQRNSEPQKGIWELGGRWALPEEQEVTWILSSWLPASSSFLFCYLSCHESFPIIAALLSYGSSRISTSVIPIKNSVFYVPYYQNPVNMGQFLS